MSSALLRSKLQPVLKEVIQEQKEAKAKEILKSVLVRRPLNQDFREEIEKRKRKAERIAMVKQALRNQKLYFDDIETRLPLIEGFLKQIQEQL